MSKDYKVATACNRMSCYAWDKHFESHCVALSEVYDRLGTFCPFKHEKGTVDAVTVDIVKNTINGRKERDLIKNRK